MSDKIIFTEKPYVAILLDKYLKCRCSNCFAPATTSCSKCDQVVYCHDRCLFEDQLYHRIECRLKNIHSKYIYAIRLIARFAIRQQYDRGVVSLTNNFPKNVKDRTTENLMSNYKHFKKDKDERLRLKETADDCRKYFVDTPLAGMKKSDIKRTICTITTNSFGIFEPTIPYLGSAIYLNASRFDHNCDPNIFVEFDGNRLMIKAKTSEQAKLIETMTEIEFNRLTLCYGLEMCIGSNFSVSTTKERKRFLNETCFFKCRCSKCEDRIGSGLGERASIFECEKCHRPYVWRRRSMGLHRTCECDQKIEADLDLWKTTKYLDMMWVTITNTDDRLSVAEITSIFERFLSMAAEVWHPTANLRYCQLKELLFSTFYNKLNDPPDELTEFERAYYFRKAIRWGGYMIQSYYPFLKNCSKSRDRILIKLLDVCDLARNENQTKYAYDELTKCAEMIRMEYGPESDAFILEGRSKMKINNTSIEK